MKKRLWVSDVWTRNSPCERTVLKQYVCVDRLSGFKSSRWWLNLFSKGAILQLLLTINMSANLFVISAVKSPYLHPSPVHIHAVSVKSPMTLLRNPKIYRTFQHSRIKATPAPQTLHRIGAIHSLMFGALMDVMVCRRHACVAPPSV